MRISFLKMILRKKKNKRKLLFLKAKAVVNQLKEILCQFSKRSKKPMNR
jgi:hypothetical protein